MLLVIPSINLTQGVCCDCIQGEQGTERFYSELSNDIIALIKLLRNENSKSIHIIDLDSFSEINNQLNINSISYISQALDIPIQVFSKFKSRLECEMLLKLGVQRIIIDKSDIINISDINTLFQKFSPTRIVFHLYQKELLETPNFSLYDFIQFISELGANRLVFTFDNNDDIKQQLNQLNQLANEFKIKITLNNGVVNSKQLLNLVKSEYNAIDSLIIGKQLFENYFPCQKIWRMVEQKIDANQQ